MKNKKKDRYRDIEKIRDKEKLTTTTYFLNTEPTCTTTAPHLHQLLITPFPLICRAFSVSAPIAPSFFYFSTLARAHARTKRSANPSANKKSDTKRMPLSVFYLPLFISYQSSGHWLKQYVAQRSANSRLNSSALPLSYEFPSFLSAT